MELENNLQNVVRSLETQLGQKCLEAASYWDAMQQLSETVHKQELEITELRQQRAVQE